MRGKLAWCAWDGVWLRACSGSCMYMRPIPSACRHSFSGTRRQAEEVLDGQADGAGDHARDLMACEEQLASRRSRGRSIGHAPDVYSSRSPRYPARAHAPHQGVSEQTPWREATSRAGLPWCKGHARSVRAMRSRGVEPTLRGLWRPCVSIAQATAENIRGSVHCACAKESNQSRVQPIKGSSAVNEDPVFVL